VEPYFVRLVILVVQHRIGEVQLDRGIDDRQLDPQPVTGADVDVGNVHLIRIRPRIADVAEHRAANRSPDRMGHLGGQQQHGLAAIVVAVSESRRNRTVVEAAQRIGAAEEIALENRHVLVPVEGGHRTDLAADHRDDRLVEEVVVITPLRFQPVVVVRRAEELRCDRTEEIHIVTLGRIDQTVAGVAVESKRRLADQLAFGLVVLLHVLLEAVRHVVDLHVFELVAERNGSEIIENPPGQRSPESNPVLPPLVVIDHVHEAGELVTERQVKQPRLNKIHIETGVVDAVHALETQPLPAAVEPVARIGDVEVVGRNLGHAEDRAQVGGTAADAEVVAGGLLLHLEHHVLLIERIGADR